MNWLSNLIPPRIRSFVGEQKEVPDNLWQKCPGCEAMLFHRDLEKGNNVCYHCGYHLRLGVEKRLELMYDDGKYSNISLPKVAYDPLKFKDRKRYVDRIREAQSKSGLKEAISVACGNMGGMPVVTAAFNFDYMGGSMGAAVGEAFVRAAELAVEKKAAFIVVPASGGARMQEGMLSLIQMARTVAAVELVKEAMLPYIVILTDPTTGGVSASFAMVGDIHIAEPGAMIGFAGRRVIEETVRETLPEDFQTAEYLLEHGMVDMVVPRNEIKAKLVSIIGILLKKDVVKCGGPGEGSKVGSGKKNKIDSKNAHSGTARQGKVSGSRRKSGGTKYANASSKARNAQSKAKSSVKKGGNANINTAKEAVPKKQKKASGV